MNQSLACSYSTLCPHELLTHVVSDYEIENVVDCLFWERGANDTYKIVCKDTNYFLRVYRNNAFPFEANEFEAEVLTHLHENNAPVAYPIRRSSGGFITRISAPEGPRCALVTATAPGHEPDYDSLQVCRLVGEAVANMHTVSDRFTTSLHRTQLDLHGLLAESMQTIRKHFAHYSKEMTLIEGIAQDAEKSVRAASENSLDWGICHGDLHGGNLHIQGTLVTQFDFEECAFGYRVYDLATFKWGVCRGKPDSEAWQTFLTAYDAKRPISSSDRSLIDTFVIIRELAETAYGIRHIKDFGHNGIMASDINQLCRRLKTLADNVKR